MYKNDHSQTMMTQNKVGRILIETQIRFSIVAFEWGLRKKMYRWDLTQHFHKKCFFNGPPFSTSFRQN